MLRDDAVKVGKEVAKEHAAGSALPSMATHPLGDRVGHLLLEAYRAQGASAAAAVVDGYLEGFNEVRRAIHAAELQPIDVANGVKFSVANTELSKAEQSSVREAFLNMR